MKSTISTHTRQCYYSTVLITYSTAKRAPAVCPSRASIVSERRTLAVWFRHRHLAPWFKFALIWSSENSSYCSCPQYSCNLPIGLYSILGEILTFSYVLFNAVPLIWCKVGDRLSWTSHRLWRTVTCARHFTSYVLQIDSLNACFTVGAGSVDSAKYKQYNVKSGNQVGLLKFECYTLYWQVDGDGLCGIIWCELTYT